MAHFDNLEMAAIIFSLNRLFLQDWKKKELYVNEKVHSVTVIKLVISALSAHGSSNDTETLFNEPA